MGSKNGKNKKKPKQSKVNPGIANDQLGENASEQFADQYANKGKNR